jgi:hypothetical protein
VSQAAPRLGLARPVGQLRLQGDRFSAVLHRLRHSCRRAWLRLSAVSARASPTRCPQQFHCQPVLSGRGGEILLAGAKQADVDPGEAGARLLTE